MAISLSVSPQPVIGILPASEKDGSHAINVALTITIGSFKIRHIFNFWHQIQNNLQSTIANFQTSRKKVMNILNHIDINPNVMLGKPVIKGTRIPIELILRKLGQGITEKEMLDAYPRLTREDIQAAMFYAAETIAHEEVIYSDQYPPMQRYTENAVSC